MRRKHPIYNPKLPVVFTAHVCSPDTLILVNPLDLTHSPFPTHAHPKPGGA